MSAVLSICGTYRYLLERQFDDGLGFTLESQAKARRFLMWVMLNPSTADAQKDDPTIRRCNGFAKRLGFDGIFVCNLYAFRTPRPAVLAASHRAGVDIVGPGNDDFIVHTSTRAAEVICAWGQPGPDPEREKQVMRLLLPRFPKIMGLTMGGYPRHPLMLPNSTLPRAWIG